MHVNSTCESTKHKILTVCFLLIVIQFTMVAVANAGTVSIDVQVDEIGRIHVAGSGSFAKCAPPNNSGMGTLQLFVNGQSIGTGPDGRCYAPTTAGSASFSCIAVPVTQTFTSATYTVGALDCTGWAYASYTLTLDMRPVINFLSPTGNISAPFTIAASASFKPMGSMGGRYGSLSCGVCATQYTCYGATVDCYSANCSCEYQNATLPHPYTTGYVYASTYTGATISSITETLPIAIVLPQDRVDNDKGGTDCSNTGQ